MEIFFYGPTHFLVVSLMLLIEESAFQGFFSLKMQFAEDRANSLNPIATF